MSTRTTTAGTDATAPGRGRLARHVVLIGMMGAGKSAVGRRLAARLGVPFVDSDAEIEAAAGMTIPEIFAAHGEAFFRDREAAVIARLLEGAPAVIATGGGAWLDPRTRARIAERGVAVWLDAPLEVLWSRVSRKRTRPLLHTPDPRGTLERLLAERRPVYALAPVRVPSSDARSVAEMAAAVEAALPPGVVIAGPEPDGPGREGESG